jgi:predicted MFS family arabinose efflux permease
MAMTTVLVRSPIAAMAYFFFVMGLVAMRVSPFSALLTGLVDDDRRGTLLSLSVALGQVGFALGGTLAGPIFETFGYLSNTLLAALSVVGMGLMVWRFVPEPARGVHPRAEDLRPEGGIAIGGRGGIPPEDP